MLGEGLYEKQDVNKYNVNISWYRLCKLILRFFLKNGKITKRGN